jgi:hypothetical protein
LVNGMAIMEPTSGGTTIPAGGANTSTGNTVGSEFWLDLDAAEAANHGGFIKQPLTIELQVMWPSLPPTGPLIGAGSLRARLEKK